MSNEIYSRIFEQSRPFLVPMTKTNKLAVGQLEKLVSFQIASLQFYLDIGLSQLKQAAAVGNLQDLQTYMTSQVKVAASLQRKLLGDAKALADLTAEFRADYGDLFRTSGDELAGSTAKATRELVEKTKETAQKATQPPA